MKLDNGTAVTLKTYCSSSPERDITLLLASKQNLLGSSYSSLHSSFFASSLFRTNVFFNSHSFCANFLKTSPNISWMMKPFVRLNQLRLPLTINFQRKNEMNASISWICQALWLYKQLIITSFDGQTEKHQFYRTANYAVGQLGLPT